MSNVRYPFEGSDSDFLKAQLLYVTCATSDKDWHSMEHSHYFSELFFVTKGTGYFKSKENKFQCRKMTLYLSIPIFLTLNLETKSNLGNTLHWELKGYSFSILKKKPL